MNLLRGIIGMAVLLVVAVAALPAVAFDWNKGASPDEYEKFMSQAGPDGAPHDRQSWFGAGLMVGLQAVKEEYAKAGATPLFCLPAKLMPEDLRDLMLAELKANRPAWSVQDATVEKLALHVVRGKFPCEPAKAQSAAETRDPTADSVLSIREYRLLNNMAISGSKPSLEGLVFFVTGLRATAMEASDAYVAAGARRRLCIPADIDHYDLLVVITNEMVDERAYWDARVDESLVALALQAFARKWPCQ